MYGSFSQSSIYNLTLKITVRVIQRKTIYNCGKIFSKLSRLCGWPLRLRHMVCMYDVYGRCCLDAVLNQDVKREKSSRVPEGFITSTTIP